MEQTQRKNNFLSFRFKMLNKKDIRPDSAKIKEFLPINKVGCVLPMVILSKFRIGQFGQIGVGLGWINSG